MNYIFWIAIAAFLIVMAMVIRKRNRLLREAGQKKQSDNVIILTDVEFEKTIREGVTLIDFWAPWCTPCRIQGPVISELADKYSGKVKVCKVNVDDHKKLAVRMKIRNIPNIILFKDGKPVKQIVGVKSKHSLIKAVDSLLG